MGNFCCRRSHAGFVLAEADLGEPTVTCDVIDSVTLTDVLEPIPSVRSYRPSTTSLDLDELLRIESSTDDFEVQKAVQDEVRRRQSR